MLLADITKKYDVQNMSPRDMVNMANDLQKAGAISEEDALTLKFQPALSPLNNTEGGPGWATGADTPINFLAQWQSRLEFDQSIHNTANIAVDRKITNILGNLAALRESGSSQAIPTSTSATGGQDFTNMTPNQMSRVAEDLFDSGKINRQQLIMLWATGLTHGRMGENGKYIPPTEAEIASHINTPMDYVQYSKDRISYAESEGLTSDPQYGYESWKSLLATLQGTAA
jgi:hypothetical protein